MISVSEILAQYKSAMGIHETATLRRAGTPPTEVTVLARVWRADPEPLDGTSQQNLWKGVILGVDTTGAAIALPISSNQDRLIWAGKTLTITKSDGGTRRVGGRVVAINLELAGA